jgi:hypothetical protein
MTMGNVAHVADTFGDARKAPGGTGLAGNLQHGAYSRIPLSDLPKPFKFVRRFVGDFRRAVEAAVITRDGAIGPYQASRIRTACVAMRQAACVERILRDGGAPGTGTLTHEQWQGYSDRAVRYSEAADRALADLGLDTQSDPLADFFRQPPLPAPATIRPAVDLQAGFGQDRAADAAVGVPSSS